MNENLAANFCGLLAQEKGIKGKIVNIHQVRLTYNIIFQNQPQNGEFLARNKMAL